MKRLVFVAGIVCLLLVCGFVPKGFGHTQTGKSFGAESVDFLVCRRDAIVQTQEARLVGNIAALISTLPTTKSGRWFRYQCSGTTAQAAIALTTDVGIRFFEKNVVGQAYVIPTDPLLSNPHSYAMFLHNMPEAWDVSTTAEGVIAIVLDSGIDLDHPDLRDTILVNSNRPQNTQYDGPIGHGTACASLIGATGNNGQGMAGVCWQKGKVKIISVHILDGNGWTDAVFTGMGIEDILLLVAQFPEKRFVINCSFGFKEYSQFLFEMFAKLELKNMLIVAAAGNDHKSIGGSSRDHAYPAEWSLSFSNLVCVGSVDSNGGQSGFSNFGPAVNIWAAGDDVIVARPTYVPKTTPDEFGNEPYRRWSGTSFGTPLVTGGAQGKWSHNQNLSGAQLKALLLKTTRQSPVSSSIQLLDVAALYKSDQTIAPLACASIEGGVIHQDSDMVVNCGCSVNALEYVVLDFGDKTGGTFSSSIITHHFNDPSAGFVKSYETAIRLVVKNGNAVSSEFVLPAMVMPKRAAPTVKISVLNDYALEKAEPLQVAVSLTNPSGAYPATVTLDWGDRKESTTVVFERDSTVTSTRIYQVPGEFTVTATVVAPGVESVVVATSVHIADVVKVAASYTIKGKTKTLHVDASESSFSGGGAISVKLFEDNQRVAADKQFVLTASSSGMYVQGLKLDTAKTITFTAESSFGGKASGFVKVIQ